MPRSGGLDAEITSRFEFGLKASQVTIVLGGFDDGIDKQVVLICKLT